MTDAPPSPATTPTAPAADDRLTPPLPGWAYTAVNPAMRALLRSPLHGLLSNGLMLLSFTGRKTGKHYTIPVGYLDNDGRLYIFSHAGWWRNLPGQRVTLRLRGQEVHGTARRLEDRREIAALVQLAIARRGEGMARRMGLLDYADPAATGPLPRRTTFFEITLDRPT